MAHEVRYPGRDPHPQSEKELLMEAWKRSEGIIAEAQQQANRILEEARNTASKIVADAEYTSRRITEEARKKVEADTNRILTEAEHKFSRILEETRKKLPEEAHKIVSASLSNNISAHDGGVEAKAVRKTEEVPDPEHFDGIVELALVPPLHLDTLLSLHKRLKQLSDVEVLNVSGSVDKGITIRTLIRTPIPLLGLIRELPVVKQASCGNELAQDAKCEEKRLLKRIIVTTS